MVCNPSKYRGFIKIRMFKIIIHINNSALLSYVSNSYICNVGKSFYKHFSSKNSNSAKLTVYEPFEQSRGLFFLPLFITSKLL